MRENMGLYRGKRKDGKGWVVGALYKQSFFYGSPCNAVYIITSTESLDYDQALEYHEVDPETVGQFVGRCDSNGTKIFDGDIVKIMDGTGCVEPIVGVIQFENCGFFFKFGKYGKALFGSWSRECYVIGNCFDNPELLEEVK